MPMEDLRAAHQRNAPIPDEIQRLAREFKVSTLEGLTSFPDAFRMLGMRKTATFYEAARELGLTG